MIKSNNSHPRSPERIQPLTLHVSQPFCPGAHFIAELKYLFPKPLVYRLEIEREGTDLAKTEEDVECLRLCKTALYEERPNNLLQIFDRKRCLEALENTLQNCRVELVKEFCEILRIRDELANL